MRLGRMRPKPMTEADQRRDLAERNSYFWLPCPICGEYMAGFEWHDVHGHLSSIPELDQPNTSGGICQGCTALGIGCYTTARLREGPHARFLHHDCPETRRGLRDSGRPEPEGGYQFPIGARS